MLVARTMGSHGGRHSLPFGYDANGIQGIGLPDFHIPGPPPGQPLLNEREHEEIDQFFTAFDNDSQTNQHDIIPHYSDNVGQFNNWNMPPTFVGSETSLRPPQNTDWQHHQMASYNFNGATMTAMGQQITHFENQGQYPPFFEQSHSAQHGSQHIQQGFGQSWQQHYPNQAMPMGRPDMRFGSDPNFQHSGYTAPSGPVEADMSFFNAFESHSTAPNTQPNTQPNTEPSSPTLTKKRKIDEFQRDMRHNGQLGSSISQTGKQRSSTSQHRKRQSFVKNDQPITPLSKPHTPQEFGEEADADAEYDEYPETEPPRSPSPSVSRPEAKARVENSGPSTKTSRPRKKSIVSETPSKSKSKSQKDSSGDATPTARVPLTAAQKKANHTNSEQRRRDATAKAYAELYDMVPEIAEMGKQSTMKRLEVVVEKVKTVKDQLERLRLRLNVDPITGASLVGNAHGISSSDIGDPRVWQR